MAAFDLIGAMDQRLDLFLTTNNTTLVRHGYIYKLTGSIFEKFVLFVAIFFDMILNKTEGIKEMYQ